MTSLPDIDALLQRDGRVPPFSESSWFDHVERVVATLDVGSGTRVWDVTCGAGSFLWPLAQNGYIVGGCDGSPERLQTASTAIPGGVFAVSEPWAFNPADPVDVVVASRGFSDCSSSDQARGMVARMLAKATHAVAFLDIDEEQAPAGVDRVRLFRMLAELGAGSVQFEHDATGRLMAFVKV